MKKIILLAFIPFMLSMNGHASNIQIITPPCDSDVRSRICTKHFKEGSEFTTTEKKEYKAKNGDDVTLKVDSSGPVLEEVNNVISFGNSNNNSNERENNSPQFKMLKNNETVFKIFCSDAEVGKVTTTLNLDNPTDIYINRIDVNEESRAKGIGTQAIALVVDTYTENASFIESFYARIAGNNIASQRAFEKNDFIKQKNSFSMGLYTFVRKK